jgi:phosphate transport system permease protein
MRTLTANIALEMAYATGLHRSVLFVSGLFLMGLVLVMVLSGDYLERKSLHE